MATTHLTLEEAAQRLGISPEELKRRLKTDPMFKILVPIRDGANVRFKASAVDELARQMGMASDPGIPLLPLEPTAPSAELDSDDFKVPPLTALPKQADSDSDDIFSISSIDESATLKAKPDSDVRLEASTKTKRPEERAASVPTEEIEVSIGSIPAAPGASSSKLTPPSSSKIAATEAAPPLAADSDSSEFELSLDSDSDDFELQLTTDTGEASVSIGDQPASSPPAGASGINLRQPADSGLSLEKDGSGDAATTSQQQPSDADLDFELTLDSNTAASGIKISGLTAQPSTVDSDSEFELTLDDSGGSVEHAALEELGVQPQAEDRGDIFETDFEIPQMEESGSEAVVLEDTETESSEVELVDAGESASEVMVVEEEGVDLAEVDLEEGPSASKALRGVSVEEEELAVPAAALPPAPWGPLPAILLLLILPLMFIGMLASYQAVETMVGYQQPQKPVAPLLRQIASIFDMELKDQ